MPDNVDNDRNKSIFQDNNALASLNAFSSSTYFSVTYDLSDHSKWSIDEIKGYSIDSQKGISFNGSHLKTIDKLLPKLWGIQSAILSTFSNGIQEFSDRSFYLLFTSKLERYRINSCVSFTPSACTGNQITYICKISFSPYNLEEGVVYYVSKYHNDFSFRLSHECMWRTEAPLPLTLYEKQVFRLCLCGLSEKEIADNFCISAGRVKQHKKSIIKKLKVSNMTQAAIVNEIFNLVNSIPKQQFPQPSL